MWRYFSYSYLNRKKKNGRKENWEEVLKSNGHPFQEDIWLITITELQIFGDND